MVVAVVVRVQRLVGILAFDVGVADESAVGAFAPRVVSRSGRTARREDPWGAGDGVAGEVRGGWSPGGLVAWGEVVPR